MKSLNRCARPNRAESRAAHRLGPLGYRKPARRGRHIASGSVQPALLRRRRTWYRAGAGGNEGRESPSEAQVTGDQAENLEKIQTLQTELTQARGDQAENLEKMQALETELAQARGDHAENLRKIQALETDLAQAYKADETARAALQRGKDEASPTSLSIKDLTTWTLLRAIVSSPGIREQYPDLLKSMEQYLEGYGRQERSKGNQEAYSAALSILESVGPGAKGP